jgi:hypothetical protein
MRILSAAFRAVLAPARARRVWTALILAGASPLTGCYTTRPLTGAPAPGTTVLLDLNDRARVALGERIGPSATRIAGIAQPGTDSTYVLHISAVEYLNGQSNQWSGEPFTVPMSLVSQAWQRQFSRSRTVALGTGLTAALLAAVLKMNFNGNGSSTTGGDPRPGGGGT